MPLNLSPVETRILGCLLEKERTTPENYPLSLNSLILACNQTTNRDPVTAYDESTVQDGIDHLREKKLVTVVFGAGNRVQKYRHNLPEHFELDNRDVAVMSVLLLRGPQTAGEIRSRSERIFHFAGIEEIETCLTALAQGEFPLIRLLPQQPGQKERRYVQCFSAEPEAGWQSAVHESLPSPTRDPSRLDSLESQVALLREELATLKSQFAAFQKQFE
jgi:uncharacterized protein YceH (UPF0502 family)